MRGIIRKTFSSSYQLSILSLYVPIIVLFILITGIVSYLVASTQIEQNTQQHIRDTVTQTRDFLNNRLSDVFEQLVSLDNHPDTLAIVAKDPDKLVPDDYVKMNNHLNRIYTFNSPILESILVRLHGGRFVLSKSESLVAVTDSSIQEYWKRYHESRFDYYWTSQHEDEMFPAPSGKTQVISVFKLIGTPDSEAKGILLFQLRKDFFDKTLGNVMVAENGYLMLLNKDGIVTGKAIKDEYAVDARVIAHMQALGREKGSFEFQKPHGKKMVVMYDTLGVNKWKIAAVVPKDEMLQKVNTVRMTAMFLMTVCIAAAILLAYLLARYLARPITLLVHKMRAISEGAHGHRLQLFAPHEIGILYNGISDLGDRVHTLLDQIKLEQERKRQLELMVMQAQINPHFLYNTLYSIKGLCDMGRNEEASAMVTALSQFFRISISRGQEMISIQEEIEHISHYLFIQKMRYGDDFSYEIDLEPQILSLPIIKLTLQPIVENAIYHGVKQTREQGLIRISGYQADGEVRFEIRDNGKGIPPEKLEAIHAALQTNTGEGVVGFGLRSIQERLRIHYGPASGLRLESEPGGGTCVIVTIRAERGVAVPDVQHRDCG